MELGIEIASKRPKCSTHPVKAIFLLLLSLLSLRAQTDVTKLLADSRQPKGKPLDLPPEMTRGT